MNKKSGVIIASLAILLLIGTGTALAMGPWMMGGSMGWNATGNSTRAQHHEQMEEILEKGSYEDLVALREQTGMPMMHWVQDEETFAQMQERHRQMEELYGEDAGMMRGGFGRMGGGRGRNGGCPMWNGATS